MITVALPVHNGGSLLRRCIESIAAQDCEPGAFELVVLENASTDGSLDALRLLPPSIPLRVVASDRLLSIQENWGRLVSLVGTREFITTIGHDDVYDPGFIRTVINALAAEPGVPLLLTHFRLIDEGDRLIRPCRPMAPRETAGQFLAGRLAGIRDSFGTGYVFRSDDYRAVGGIPPYPKLIYADDALWISLARPAGIRILQEECFSYRLHSENTSRLADADGETLLRAYGQYLDFLEAETARDEGIRRALETQGPTSIKNLAGYWMLLEANRANRAGVPVRVDVIEGWRAVQRRIVERSGRTEADQPYALAAELAFSLWANQHPLRRRLWSYRAVRAAMRIMTARLKTHLK